MGERDPRFTTNKSASYEVVAERVKRKAGMCMLIKSASSSERLDEVGRVTDTRHLANCLC